VRRTWVELESWINGGNRLGVVKKREIYCKWLGLIVL
jgi:hypothetical protein